MNSDRAHPITIVHNHFGCYIESVVLLFFLLSCCVHTLPFLFFSLSLSKYQSEIKLLYWTMPLPYCRTQSFESDIFYFGSCLLIKRYFIIPKIECRTRHGGVKTSINNFIYKRKMMLLNFFFAQDFKWQIIFFFARCCLWEGFDYFYNFFFPPTIKTIYWIMSQDSWILNYVSQSLKAFNQML